MPHVEEREFVFRLALRAEFPEDYDGELDGFVWVRDFPDLAADMLRALIAAAAKHREWSVRPANRGRSSDDEVTLIVERRV